MNLINPNFNSLVFLDANINNPQDIISQIDNAEIVLLDSDRDGIKQISETIAKYKNIESIEIFSHGSNANLQLGSTELNKDNLINYAPQLENWSNHLSKEADILIYGCDVAKEESGKEFITEIANLTNADIAASEDLTGNSILGGDWDLEITTGDIETEIENYIDYDSVLATYNGKEYRLTSSNKTWQKAQREAESLGGNLVTINDIAEQNWLQETFGGEERLWIGLRDRNREGTFTWKNKEDLTYTNWALNQPNNFGRVGQDFVALQRNGQWNDFKNNLKIRGIIEIPLINSGDIGLETNNFIANEGDGTVDVTILRTQGSDGAITVDYRTINADAIGKEDYLGVSGTVTFEDGETSKSIPITLLDDDRSEDTESFSFTIDNVRGGARLLAPRTALVTIEDNDVPDNAISYNGNKYFLTSENLSWEETQNVAESFGGNLVSINDRQEEVWLQNTFGDEENFWIGINDREIEGQFEWVSNQPVTYTNWFPGEPNNGTGNQDFGIMNFSKNKQWDDRGSLTQFRGIIEIGGSNPSQRGMGNGLRGEYFNNIDFTNSTLIRTDRNINFNWIDGSPNSAIESDTFSVRWTGEIEPLYSQTYTFNTTTDDGVRLYIDEELIIDEFRDRSATTDMGTIDLVAGQRYPITLEYYENEGDALAQLAWSSPSQPLEIVPQSQLYSTPVDTRVLSKEIVVESLTVPTAIDWTPDGDIMYIAQKRGAIKVYENGELKDTPFIDLSDRVNGSRDRGLLDIAVHPDFFNGSPYVYALYTYDPPQVFNNTDLAGPDGKGNRASRLTRITADASTNFTTAVPGSEVVILGTNSSWNNFNAFANSTFNFNEPPAGIRDDGINIQDFLATDSESHTIGSVEFGIDGALYVSNGDGTSYNRVDPRTFRVQDIDNLSGKILRIDPITGEGLPDNPFYNGNPNSNRSKVYQYGLRNPFRISVDSETGKLYIGDVGWTLWEEVNSGEPGANFGWPYYEGGNGTNLPTGGYRDLPESQEFYNSDQPVTSPLFALNHVTDGINAIVLGDVYRGNSFPEEYQGDLFINDLGQGIVRNISFDESGNVESVNTFDTGANVVVQITQAPDDNLYFVDLDDGLIGRWKFD